MGKITVETCEIEGLKVITPTVFGDSRGYFMETYNQRDMADAGLDIGFTLIGMHLKKVAVPVRLSVKQIGCAMLLAARTRIPFTGGGRAVYDEEKM